MDRSWMYLAPRSSQTFVNGVQTFLNFAFERACVNERTIKCACINCLNMKYQSRQNVIDHLICSGFRPEYFKWVYHGEGMATASTSTTLNEEDVFQQEMHEMLNDVFEKDGGSGENASNSSQETNNGRNKFDDLFKEAEEKVYPNCKYNKLSCLVYLYHIKCLNGWSNKSFSMLLEFLKDLLPEGNLLPKTTQQVKKTMANLGLGYEKIHSCPNGCMLFWEDKEKDEVCSLCGSSRWKVHEVNPEHEVSPPKKKASKILRWFPLKPRLQRLFISSKTFNLMKWHHIDRVKDGKFRHPADALVWKDLKWLARGPLRSVKRYSGYLVKGYRFHTKTREDSLKTQNSGVVVTVEGANYASSRDRRPTHGMVNYYGKLNDIIELNYSGQIRVVLFKCDWVDINRGCKIDNGVTLVNFSYKAHTGANLTDDPFVLASQVDKVFYVTDPKHKDWEVVRFVKVRGAYDMGSVDDQVGSYLNDCTFDVPTLHRIRDDGDDGIDITPDMEREVNVEENDDDTVVF